MPKPEQTGDYRGMQPRTPRQILEFLCHSDERFWKRDDHGHYVVNIYALAKAMKEWGVAKRIKTPGQSTLQRAYSGESKHFREDALDALSAFFSVPKAIARGDINLKAMESWGMEINYVDIKILGMLHKLTLDQRMAIYQMLEQFLPNEVPLLPLTAENENTGMSTTKPKANH